MSKRSRRRNSEPTVVVVCRIPASLVRHLDACAGAQQISRNAEICSRLEQSALGEHVDEHGVIVRACESKKVGQEQAVNSRKVVDAIGLLLDSINRDSIAGHGVIVHRVLSSLK